MTISPSGTYLPVNAALDLEGLPPLPLKIPHELSLAELLQETLPLKEVCDLPTGLSELGFSHEGTEDDEHLLLRLEKTLVLLPAAKLRELILLP